MSPIIWLTLLVGAILLFGVIVLFRWRASVAVQRAIYSGTQMRGLLFSPDGQTIYGGGMYLTDEEYHGWVWAWETATGRFLWQNSTEGSVDTLALSPDGRTLLTAGTQGFVSYEGWGGATLWDARTGRLRCPLVRGPEASTTDNAYFTPDGLRIFGSFQDGIQVWDAQTGESLAFWKIPADKTGWPTCLHFSPDSTKLLVQAREWTDSDSEIPRGSAFVQLWDAHTGEVLQDFLMDKATRCAFSADNKWVALTRDKDDTYQIELWTVQGELRKQSPGLPPGFKPFQLSFQPDGDLYCHGNYDTPMKEVVSTPTSSWHMGKVPSQQAFLWNIQTNQLTRQPCPDEENLSPDGRLKSVIHLGGRTLGAIYRTDTGAKLYELCGLD